MDDIDLTDLLNDWPYEPGNVNVRLIRAQDGRQVIQLRIDLGILQLEMTGRPDGEKPHDFPSCLDYHVHNIKNLKDEHGVEDVPGPADDENPIGIQSEEPTTPTGEPDAPTVENPADSNDDDTVVRYSISPEGCRAIREEAVQYYHRYISLYALDEFDGVVRDAEHNLQLIDLCRRYAESDDDREAMEQLRLHTLMTRTRALAADAAARNDSKSALAALDHGLAEMTAYLEALGVPEEEYDEIAEIQLLRGMRDALVPKLPVSQKMELQERLKSAIAGENYELAAILRDELRLLRDT